MNLLKEGCCLSRCTTTLFGHQLEEARVKAKKLLNELISLESFVAIYSALWSFALVCSS